MVRAAKPLSQRERGRGEEMDDHRNKAAIAGIGCTEFSKDSGRSELHNVLRAITMAADDAGISVKDIDGIVYHNVDRVTEWQLVDCLGMKNVRFSFQSVQGAGGGSGAVGIATLALAAGLAENVVIYRALNGRSQDRYGTSPRQVGRWVDGPTAWRAPFGLIVAAHHIAMRTRRYMLEYGAESRHFGEVAVAFRKHASVNPNAYFHGRPITLEDHQASPVIVDPLRLLDITSEYDAAAAVIVTTTDRARHLKQPPAYVLGWGQATGSKSDPMTASNRESLTAIEEVTYSSQQAYQMAGVSPGDIQVLQVYDHFTSMVIMALEDLGFCKKGEGFEFVQDGGIQIGGKLPVNTHGGNLGEGYIHFMNHMCEGVRQVRGTSSNQVAGCELSMLMAGYGVTTSALILGRQP